MQLNEAQINTSKLADIFSNAFMEIINLKENVFEVIADDVPIRIIVDEKRKYILLEQVQRLNNISIEQAILIANKLNSEKMLARFYLVQEGDIVLLISDSYLTYERGIVDYHLIKTVKFFEKIVVASILDKFGDNLTIPSKK